MFGDNHDKCLDVKREINVIKQGTPSVTEPDFRDKHSFVLLLLLRWL